MRDHEKLGRALRWIREESDLKQLEVAAAAGITRPMLSAYERGKVRPTLEVLERILPALDSNYMDLARVLTLLNSVQRPPEIGGAGAPRDAAGKADGDPLVLGGTAESRAFEYLRIAVQQWLAELRKAVYREAPGEKTSASVDGGPLKRESDARNSAEDLEKETHRRPAH